MNLPPSGEEALLGSRDASHESFPPERSTRFPIAWSRLAFIATVANLGAGYVFIFHCILSVPELINNLLSQMQAHFCLDMISGQPVHF
jgi:hypothetical protein